MSGGPTQAGEEEPDVTHADEVDAEEREQVVTDVELGAAERLVFFSDAVVAIALTLLALELPVPSGDSVHEVLVGLGEGIPEYIAFMISFAVISTHWRTHHRVFRHVDRVDRPIIALNMGWLFLIVITPWSTKLLSSGHINVLRFGQYAAIQTVQYALLAIMIVVLVRGDLLRPGTDLAQLRGARRRVVPVMIGFGLSIPVFGLIRLAGISPYWGYASWWLLPTIAGYGGRALRGLRGARGEVSRTDHPGRTRPR